MAAGGTPGPADASGKGSAARGGGGPAGRASCRALLSAYVTTMRPYLMPVSGLAGLAGMALAGVSGAWVVAGGVAVFSLSYGFGQALTDCFQQDTDRLSAPLRPLVQGRIGTAAVLLVSLLGLAACMAALACVNLWTLALGGLAVLGLLVYTPLKRHWWSGPMANAWVVALLPMMGFLLNRANSLSDLPARTGAWAAAAVSFTAYANFVLVGYLKDVSADRQAGYETFPVRFGWRRTALVSHVWAAAALGAAAWTVAWAAPWQIGEGLRAATALPWGLLGLGAACSLSAQAALHRTHREDQAHGPIVNVVRAFLFYHAAIVTAARPRWWPLAVGLILAFEVLARMRPDRRQV